MNRRLLRLRVVSHLPLVYWVLRSHLLLLMLVTKGADFKEAPLNGRTQKYSSIYEKNNRI